MGLLGVGISTVSRAAVTAFLYRRAWHVTVGAIYTAVPRQWFEQHSAVCALVEKLAGIGRHLLGFCMSTLWTGKS